MLKTTTDSIIAAVICLVAVTAEARPPNVLIILADDLGYSDLGCYGSEIATPHLDQLAENGLRFTQFYNTARCWPTRAAIMTGYYAQQVRRDTLPGIPSGGRGKRPAWAPLMPKLLKPLGYRAYHSGKWHIDGLPIAEGFDRSYYLRDQGRFFNPQVHYEDDRKLAAVKPGTDYYGTIAIADHALKCLQEHQQEHSQKPFFHFLAFTAPHFPLHALPKDIARYADRYQTGWQVVRRERWKKIQGLGLLDAQLSTVERDVGPPYDFPEAFKILGTGEVNRPLPWEDLTPEQSNFQAAKMALHAAMIDRIDQEVGRVLKQLQKMDALENTLIFFLSDNGASAEIMVRADGHDPQAQPGSAASYLCLGPGWSTSSNTPFRRHKTWTHEGGISTPLIVHWPQGISARGEIRANPGHVIDLLPTIMQVAGDTVVETAQNKPDQSAAPRRPGQSLLPAFAQDHTVPHEYIWWMHEGNRAIRVGDWKLVAAGADAAWELYNLRDDRTETKDLAAAMPQKVKTLAESWQARLQEFRSHALQDLPR